MKTRKDVIDFSLSFKNAYEDYPFDDFNWTVMRRSDTSRGFAWIFERQENIWINLKVEPLWGEFMCDTYNSVVPGYHMNKKHWISVILDGTVPENELINLITESYTLCGK